MPYSRVSIVLVGVLAATSAGALFALGTPSEKPSGSPSGISLADSGPVRYGRDIRPLLSDRCFFCHGPDRAKQQAGLRLDIREEALAPRKNGAAIVPGNAEASALWQRINDHDPSRVMPTPDSNKRPLNEAEKDLLRRWINEGAAYEKHWAFDAPQAHEPPAVKDQKWARNEIDRFVLARIEKAGTHPSPEASPEDLVRRVFLDLTGLPPTPDETDAYLADTRADRYERLIDRILGEEPYRTRYAERMSVPWLDIARYADTCGIHMDAGRQMWLWRDWVIEAFRQNKPYDRFITEQLAGDLMPEATVDQVIASGFNRNHVTTDEGGAINDEYLLEYAVDRVNTTGAAFLGLSVGCARCHDHKFDPITQEDFYSLIAFFNSNEEPGLYSQQPDSNRAFEPFIEVPRKDDQGKLSILAEAEQRAKDQQASAGEAEKVDLEKFVGGVRAGFAAAPASVVSAASSEGAMMTVQGDGSVLVGGANPNDDEHTIVLRTDATGMRMMMLEALTDPSLGGGNRVGRAPNGNAVLDHIAVEAVSVADPMRREPVDLAWAWADYEQENGDYRVVNALTKGEGRQWAVRSHEVPGMRTAIFGAARPFGFEGGTELRVTLNYRSPYAQHVFGRVRLTPMTATDAAIAQLPYATSNWYIAGPFTGGPGAAYGIEYGPEAETAFVRGKRFTHEEQSDGWRHAPGVVDGQVAGLAASVGCEFVARQIYSPDARKVELSMGSDDGLVMYLNGRKVFENQAQRGAAPDQDRVSLDLVPGENFLVCKVVNTGGAAGFFSRGIPREGEFGRDMVALVAGDGRVRAEAAEAGRNAWRIRFSPTYIAAQKEIERVAAERAQLLSNTPKTMVMRERAMPTDTYVHMRGAYDKPDKNRKVERAVPKALGSLAADAPRNRLGLAQWIVSRENPITARVVVNRVWEQFFGAGIVRTSDDLGLQGEWPTNPDLLDTLAVRFRDGAGGAAGWDLQRLVRDIVTSATYRQTSRVRPEVVAADPANRLVAYFPRQRLGAEQIRDQALFVAGLLVERPGGPSVKPYQPEGLWQEVAMLQSNTRNYQQGMGDDLWRRSMYTYWKRAAPPPTMLTLDAPTREFCTTRRLVTNTPLQALVLWNDPQFVEAARMTAERTILEPGDERSRIERLFRRATGTHPSATMLARMEAMLAESRARYAAKPDDAEKFLDVGERKSSASIPAPELAAWTMLANAVLSSDATIVKD